jgi:hypothetical protein
VGWVEVQVVFLDRFPQHQPEHGDDAAGGDRRDVGAQVDSEGLDVVAADLVEPVSAEPGQDVDPQH